MATLCRVLVATGASALGPNAWAGPRPPSNRLAGYTQSVQAGICSQAAARQGQRNSLRTRVRSSMRGMAREARAAATESSKQAARRKNASSQYGCRARRRVARRQGRAGSAAHWQYMERHASSDGGTGEHTRTAKVGGARSVPGGAHGGRRNRGCGMYMRRAAGAGRARGGTRNGLCMRCPSSLSLGVAVRI